MVGRMTSRDGSREGEMGTARMMALMEGEEMVM